MLSAYHTLFSSPTRTTASEIDRDTDQPFLETKMDNSQPDELNYNGAQRVGSEDTTTGIAKSGNPTGQPAATAANTSTPTKLRRSERRASMASSQVSVTTGPSSAPTAINNEGPSSKSASPTKRQPVTLRLTMGKSQSISAPELVVEDGRRAMTVSSEQPVATPRKRAHPPIDDISSMMFIDFTPPSMDAGQSDVPLHTPPTFAQQQPTKIRLQFKEPTPEKGMDVSTPPTTESRKLKLKKSPLEKSNANAAGSMRKAKATSPGKSAADSTPADKKTGSKVKPIRLTTSSTEPSPKKAKSASKNASPTKVSAKTEGSTSAAGVRVGSPTRQLFLSLGSSANGSGSPNEDRPLTVKLRAGKNRPPGFKWTEFKTVGAELVTLRLPTDDDKPKKKSASSSKRSSPMKNTIASSPSKNASRSPVKLTTASESSLVNKKPRRSKGNPAGVTKPLKPISDETKQALKVTVMKHVAAKTKVGSKSPSKASPKSKASKDTETTSSSKSASPKSASKKAPSSPATKASKQPSPLNEKVKDKEASPLSGEKKVKDKKQKKSPLKEADESGKRLRNKKSKVSTDPTPKGLSSRQRKARLADEEAILAEDEDLTNKKVDESGEMVNLEYCFACHGDGNLICCEGCPKSFHFTCTDPPIDPNEVPEEAWFCCECRYRREHNDILPSFPSNTSNMEQLYGYLIEKVKSMNPKAFVLPKRLRKTADKDSASLANNLSFVGPKSASLQSMNDSQATLHYGGFYQSVNGSETSQLHHMSHAPHHVEQFSAPGTSPSLENVSYLGGHGAVAPRHKERTTDDGACFACNRGAPSIHRLLIKCDQCTLLWHLDCLPYPLAVYPSSRRAWSCPLHLNSLENLGDLSPETANRVARSAAVSNIPVDSWNITPSLRTPALKTGPHLIPEQSLRLNFGMTSAAAILLQRDRKREDTYTGCRVPDMVKAAYEQVRTLI